MPSPKLSVFDPRISDERRQGLFQFLFNKLHLVPFCECWLWDGWHDGKEYGKFEICNIALFVHRTMWELHHGVMIPTGLLLDHSCRIHACCNPGHLEPVTVKVNTDRGKGVHTQFRCTGMIPSTGDGAVLQ